MAITTHGLPARPGTGGGPLQAHVARPSRSDDPDDRDDRDDPDDPDDPDDRGRGSWPANEQRRRLAITGYLGRYKGQTRVHTASDLRVFLAWCVERGLDPLGSARVGRVQVEAFVRWMQETCAFKPSTVSRRVSVVAGFYRTAVIDGLVSVSPAT